LAVLLLCTAGADLTVGIGPRLRPWVLAGALLSFVTALLCWATLGKQLSVNSLAQGTLFLAVPLVLGAMAGVLCERVGVVNVSIEGQLLVGAFTGALVGTLTGSLWVGLLAAGLSGVAMGGLLAVFAIRYLVDQVILGVVLNVFALGLTGFFYDRLMQPQAATYNQPGVFGPVRIPLLADIPLIGGVLFDQNVFVYLMYVTVAALHVALFHTRWGLRVRAVGEQPGAADSVGIAVNRRRYATVLLGGLVAGLGGAFFTIGSVSAFSKNMTSGKGFIALAAVIFGRWSPTGALGAALLFAFADQLQSLLSIIGTPIPSEVLLMAPYLATILAVAGGVGRVRAPAADGTPYVKP
ncbi:MAG: ABC transporter permease, partial [Pseudonocardia sp.]|nr:ABC transporter permease [Pseudonocardia sp.]